jgi:hypothetical protein
MPSRHPAPYSRHPQQLHSRPSIVFQGQHTLCLLQRGFKVKAVTRSVDSARKLFGDHPNLQVSSVPTTHYYYYYYYYIMSIRHLLAPNSHT